MKIGLFGIGLDTYWPQFAGLKDRLESYLNQVHQKLLGLHPDIVFSGLVDTADKAFEAGDRFKSENVSIVFLYVSTYAISSTVLPVVQKAGVPVIVLNISPEAAIDYNSFNKRQDRTSMTGEWLAIV